MRARRGRGVQYWGLAFLFVFFCSPETETGRRPQRFTVVEERLTTDVQRHPTSGCFGLDHDGNRTALDTLTKGDPTPAG